MKKIIVLAIISLMFPVSAFAEDAVEVTPTADVIEVPTISIGIPSGPATPITPTEEVFEAPHAQYGSGGQNIYQGQPTVTQLEYYVSLLKVYVGLLTQLVK